jgi:uncharacterized protein with NRDE domain
MAPNVAQAAARARTERRFRDVSDTRLRYTESVCTIVVLRGVRADCPLILATNRDEFFARQTAGPSRLLDRPSTVGGRDLVAQGTWMGVTREGLFVGVTNHRRLEGNDPPGPLRSRGALVLQALALGSVQAITRFVATVDAREYNTFNLMWGDASALLVGYAREEQREVLVETVPEGVHVLPNDRLDSPSFVKVARAKQLILPHVHAPLPELSRALQDMLADRVLPAWEDIPDPPKHSRFDHALLRELAALSVRTPTYGTRSSTVVMLAPGRVVQYLFADGPPDRTAFVDVTPLF